MVRTHINLFQSTATMAAVSAQTRFTRNLHNDFAAKRHSNGPMIVGNCHWSNAFENCGYLAIAFCVGPQSIRFLIKSFVESPQKRKGQPLCLRATLVWDLVMRIAPSMLHYNR